MAKLFRRHLVRRKSLDEMFLEAAWGMEVNLDALNTMFTPSLHTEVMTLNLQNISLLGNYLYSDVEEIAKVVTKVNQEADESGKAKVKKGLLLPF